MDDFHQGPLDIRPIDITFANLGELVGFPRKPFEVEFYDSLAELANPVARIAVLPMVTDVTPLPMV